MPTRVEIVAMSNDQLIQALIDASNTIADCTSKFIGTPAACVARRQAAQEARVAAEAIRAEITLRSYKATVGGPLLTERKPGWCWGDARPAINRTQKKGGGVWMPWTERG